MANVGTAKVEIVSRTSEEARRELELMLKLARAMPAMARPLTPLPPAVPTPVKRRTTTTTRSRVSTKMPPEKADTKYLRETYPEDDVIQGYADLIERFHPLWQLIKTLETVGINIAGAGLVRWDVSTAHEVRDAVRHSISIELVNKEATSRALK
jgi:hypothetical protein